MGEKLEDLGRLKIGTETFLVEANLGLAGPGGRDIHLQNDKIRIQMYEKHFLEFLAKIISSDAKLKKLKRKY